MLAEQVERTSNSDEGVKEVFSEEVTHTQSKGETATFTDLPR